MPGASPKLLNLNQDHPSKKVVFLVKSLNPYKIEILISASEVLREVLESPNFGHMTTSTTKFKLRDEILLMTSQIKIMT